MSKGDESATGLVQSISNNLGAVFRHLLPGILIIGAADVAHPSWFSRIDLRSWEHILVIAVVALALGNALFAINRYGIHQLADYLLYLFKWGGPARNTSWLSFHDDLGKYIANSICSSAIPAEARQHLAFRVSSVLLLYTVTEIGVLARLSHESGTFFDRHPLFTLIGSLVIFFVASWQGAIVRYVDYHVVEFEKKNSTIPT